MVVQYLVFVNLGLLLLLKYMYYVCTSIWQRSVYAKAYYTLSNMNEHLGYHRFRSISSNQISLASIKLSSIHVMLLTFQTLA